MLLAHLTELPKVKTEAMHEFLSKYHYFDQTEFHNPS